MRHDAVRPVVPRRTALGPAGIVVGERQAPDSITGKRIAAVRNGVGLDETRLSEIPVLGADGELTVEQRAGAGRRGAQQP